MEEKAIIQCKPMTIAIFLFSRKHSSLVCATGAVYGDNGGSEARRDRDKDERATEFKGKLDCRTTNNITFRLIILAPMNAIQLRAVKRSPFSTLQHPPRATTMPVFAPDNFRGDT